jgi:hypothetical protein
VLVGTLTFASFDQSLAACAQSVHIALQSFIGVGKVILCFFPPDFRAILIFYKPRT